MRSEGFAPPKYTQIPDEILDGMGSRPYTETLVLLYIARRTFGFKRQNDAISYDQFLNGIVKRDGERLDTGCGIKSRTTLAATIKSLEEQGLIEVERTQRGNEKQTTIYRLRLQTSEVVQDVDHPPAEVVHLLDYRSPSAGLGVVREMDIQHTVQHTGLQQTDTPLPPTGGSGCAAETPPSDEGVAHPDTGLVELERPTPPPPTPAPADLERAEARILDARQGLDRQSRTRRRSTANGWDEQPPARLEKIQSDLWDRWRAKNPARIARKDLLRVGQAVAPDEAKRFGAQTQAYLKATDDEYLMSLKRWLEEWRDYQPKAATPKPRSMAEAMLLQSEAERRLRKEA